MKVKVKKLSKEATIPTYAKYGDAGLDLTAVSRRITDKFIEYDTGLAFEIPNGFVGLLFPRSSVTNKTLMVKNSVGVVDSCFRGSVRVRFETTEKDQYMADIYEVGDRVGQIIIMPYPKIELIESDQLSETERGDNGYGSTGR